MLREGQTTLVVQRQKPVNGVEATLTLKNPVLMGQARQLPKRFFRDVDLDVPVFDRLSGRQGALRETVVNGQSCFVGWVRFVSPKSFWDLFNPFSKAKDAFGNAYWVRGFRGFCIALASVQSDQAVPVTCLKRGDYEFEVVRWGIAGDESSFEEKPPLCECGGRNRVLCVRIQTSSPKPFGAGGRGFGVVPPVMGLPPEFSG